MHFPGGPAAKTQVLPIQVQPLVRKLRSHMRCREREREGDTNRTNDSETSWATWSVPRSRLPEQAVASWVFPCRSERTWNQVWRQSPVQTTLSRGRKQRRAAAKKEERGLRLKTCFQINRFSYSCKVRCWTSCRVRCRDIIKWKCSPSRK